MKKFVLKKNTTYKWSCLLNPLEQIWHTNFLSSLCVNLCLTSALELLNTFPHWLQALLGFLTLSKPPPPAMGLLVADEPVYGLWWPDDGLDGLSLLGWAALVEVLTDRNWFCGTKPVNVVIEERKNILKKIVMIWGFS